MAAFKYKDLMITVGINPGFINPPHCVCFGYSWAVTYKRAVQAAEELYLGGGITPAPHCLYRTEIFLTCSGISFGCPARTLTEVAGPVAYPGPGPEDLATVKVQLQQALSEIEKQERAAAENAEPRTAAEVESLQTKLHEAISELERRKQELRRESRE